jgi:hypothetical protein
MKRQRAWLNAPGLTLITTMLASSQLDACGPLTLAPLEILIPASHDLPAYTKDDHN